jgi:hypothetical protein
MILFIVLYAKVNLVFIENNSRLSKDSKKHGKQSSRTIQ